MQDMYAQSVRWVQSLWYDGAWWFHHLDRQEWLVVLGLVTCLGFSCLRGYGSRLAR